MRALLRPLVVLAVSLVSASALGDVDCPVGTKKKTEGANDWCEPSVCLTDAQCGAGEVCKPVPLCVEIGKLKATSAQPDAGERLMARQRCGPDRACPASTSCLDGLRCISRTDADKMGLLAGPATSAGAAGGETKKCGCRVVGARPNGEGGGALVVVVALAVAAGRRRGPSKRTAARAR